MQKITPHLWFDNNAEEAMSFYLSVFKNGKAGDVTYYNTGTSKGEQGKVMSVSFELEGQQFIGLNAGPYFKFNEAVSFFVSCEDQAEVDYYWEKLTADGGEESQCGWLKDKFGLSWQIVPKALGELLSNPDKAKAKRAMEAMLKMHKIDVSELQRASGQA